MKKLLVLLFSILISFNSYGKTICYESNSVQERNGLWYLPNQQEPFTGDNLCEFEGSNQYKSKGQIKQGKRDGKWTYWHASGGREREATFKDGKEDDKWTRWYENGQIESEGNYKDGKKEGKETWWHKNGQKWSEINYKDGKKKWNCWGLC